MRKSQERGVTNTFCWIIKSLSDFVLDFYTNIMKNRKIKWKMALEEKYFEVVIFPVFDTAMKHFLLLNKEETKC